MRSREQELVLNKYLYLLSCTLIFLAILKYETLLQKVKEKADLVHGRGPGLGLGPGPAPALGLGLGPNPGQGLSPVQGPSPGQGLSPGRVHVLGLPLPEKGMFHFNLE